MNKPLVSVIVPVYNAEKYLKKCLDSIVNQTYTKLEIILIDDGSTDGSGEICNFYAKKDGRIKVVHKANGGVSSARNIGISKAEGDFVGFVDSDDFCTADMYETLVKNAVQYAADISMCGIKLCAEYETGEVMAYDPVKVYDFERTKIEFLKGNPLSASLVNKIYRKSIIRDVKISEELVYGEDYKFNYDVIKNVTRTAVTAEKKYIYIQRSDSVMHSYREKHMQDILNILEYIYSCEKDEKAHLRAFSNGYMLHIRTVVNRAIEARQATSEAFEMAIGTLKRHKKEFVGTLDEYDLKECMILCCDCLWLYKAKLYAFLILRRIYRASLKKYVKAFKRSIKRI